MNSATNPILRCADVEVDTLRGCLRRNGQESYLREQTLQVFCYLVEHRTQTVTKEDLINNVWQGMAVTDDALVQCIVELRKALCDDSRHPYFIKTVPKIGYRFIGPVEDPKQTQITIQTEEVTSVQVEEEITNGDEGVSPLPEMIADRTVSSTQISTWPNFRASKRTRALAIALTLVLAAAGGLVFRFRERLWPSKQQLTRTTLPRIPGKKTVAVMFFENRSGTSQLDWLREGLGDMLITGLSRSAKLIVLNRQQLHLLLDRIGHKPGATIQLEESLDIARRSRADVIVLGSFAELGGKVRIDAQLYDGSTGELLAVESINADKVGQILTQVDLLSLKLTAQLGAQNEQMRADLGEVMTNSLEAYRYYSLAVERTHGLRQAEAIELLKKALELDPQFAMAYARIGYAYAVSWGFAEKAKPYLDKAFQLSERLTEKDRLYITAWYAAANKDYAGAIQQLREIVARYPFEIEAYFRLGYLLQGEERLDEAIEIARQGLVVDPESKSLYNLLGGLYSDIDHSEEAIAAHRQYVTLAPNEPNAHDSLGLTFQRTGRYPEAVEEYERALSLNPEFEVAVVHLGNVYFQQGRYRQAIEEFQRYIEIAPSDSERARGYGSIAHVYWKMGKLAQTQQMAKMASKYDPTGLPYTVVVAIERGDMTKAEEIGRRFAEWPNTFRGSRPALRHYLYLLGYLNLKTEKTEEAIGNFKELLRHRSLIWNIDAYEDCLANAYLHIGQFDNAIAEYERILRLNPNYPLAHYHLALAHDGKGQRQQAEIAYRGFLEVWKEADDDIPEVVLAKKRLAT